MVLWNFKVALLLSKQLLFRIQSWITVTDSYLFLHVEQSDNENISSISDSALFSHHVSCFVTLPLTLFLGFGLCLVDLQIRFVFWTMDFSLLNFLCVFPVLGKLDLSGLALVPVWWILGNTIQGKWSLNKDFKPLWCGIGHHA